jgi:hypothetical protein
MVEVDDPYEPGRQAPALKNIREHPLDYMLARKRITHPQKVAGDKFLKLYDRATPGGMRAIDYSMQKVDVSFVQRGVPAGMASAVQELGHIRRALGPTLYGYIVKIIGERKFPTELAVVEGRPVNAVSNIFALALDDLVHYFGVATGPIRGKMLAQRNLDN